MHRHLYLEEEEEEKQERLNELPLLAMWSLYHNNSKSSICLTSIEDYR